MAYVINNLMHASQLKKNKALYKKYGIKKSVFSSISSEDLPECNVVPWLDEKSSNEALPRHPVFLKQPLEIQQSLSNWSENGYAILPGFFSAKASRINELVDAYLVNNGEQKRYSDGRLMFAIKKIPEVRDIVESKDLHDILDMLMGKKVRTFQSINFLKGTQQKAHSDTYHMTTHPKGFLTAAWIALEDLDENCGPIFYYPGSHKLPYILNPNFNHGGTKTMIGENTYGNYEEAIKSQIEKRGLKKELFTAKKGDVLIWHANLLHGGEIVRNANATRKSMVLHYYTDDVICFHEITQRPTIFT